MDWQYLTRAVTHAQTLEPDALEEYLQSLSEEAPEISDDVRQIIRNANQAGGLFMTSVGDHLPDAPPLYAKDNIIGQWQIDELSGSGGMGDVYKAHRVDNLYDHIVALKVMRGDNEGRKTRFDRERQRLAMLKHAGIASIIDGGVSDQGHPYMVMDFVDGKPIFEYAQDKDMGKGPKLDLFRKVCAAVSHAHSHLILHRDLKSDNILVTADGDLKLIDFGIATLLDEDIETERGPFSLATAAPEQLKGEPLSVQTDIFALGVVLHQLLTGILPVRKPDGGVKTKTEGLPRDLQEILEKGLQNDPAQRYETVAALSADLSAYQSSHPVMARNGSQLYRIGKLLKRTPIVSALAASVVIALMGGLGVSQHYARSAQAEAARANAELKRAEWKSEQSTLRSAISNQTSDSLRFAFGRENIDNMTEHLLEFEKRNLAAEKKDPFTRAVSTYVVGRQFLNRNDYVNARAVLEPWVMDDYGKDAQLLSLGQANLGHAYRALGETELAVDMFEKAAEFYIGTPDENSMNHAATAIEAAIISDRVELTDKAVKVVDVVLSQQDNPYAKLYLLAKTSQMEYKQRRWGESYAAIRKTIDIVDKDIGDLGLQQGMDTRRLRLAEMEIYYKKDFAAAQEQIDKARDIEKDSKGESITSGRIFALEADIKWSEKRYQEALKDMTDAAYFYEKYGGESASYFINTAKSAMLHAQLNDIETAKRLLSKLQDSVKDEDAPWLVLAKLFIIHQEEGLAATQTLYDSSLEAKDAFQKDLEKMHYLKTLKESGLVI